MKTLGIDLETKSEVPIKDCGSFRYIDDPSFEILLFGFSVDGEPAEVIDLTAGECIPRDILDALHHKDVLNTGWNNAWATRTIRYFLCFTRILPGFFLPAHNR